MNRHYQRIILHISDLHRTPGEELSNRDLWTTLIQDIRHGYRDTNKVLTKKEPPLPDLLDQGETIDIVVVSGDLTQTAGTAEYTLQLHKYPRGSSGKGVEDRVAASL